MGVFVEQAKDDVQVCGSVVFDKCIAQIVETMPPFRCRKLFVPGEYFGGVLVPGWAKKGGGWNFNTPLSPQKEFCGSSVL